MLELGPDEAARNNKTLRVSDRDFYVISKLDDSDDDLAFSATEPSTVWTTGPCGESPVQVATDIKEIFILPIWPDLVLGCEKTTGNVVVLDPTGATAPHILFPAVSHDWTGCGFDWTDVGLLSLDRHDEEFGALVLYPYPADPRSEASAPEVLLDPIPLTPSNTSGRGLLGNVLYTFPTEALARTPDDEVVRIDLATRTVSTLQVEVAAFDVSRDGGHLIWQHSGVTKADPEFPEGQIYLRDRANNSEVILAATSLRTSGFPLNQVDRGIVQLRLGRTDKTRVFFLSDFAHVDIPWDYFLQTQLPDGRWLGGSIFTSNYLEATDLRTGEKDRLFPRKARLAGLEDGAIRALQVSKQSWRAEGPLWRVPLDGSPPTKLAQRATRSALVLDDDRVLTSVEANAQWLTALVLAGPDEELRIDDRVHRLSIDTSQVADERLLRYSVTDGERSGVYLAHLPPPP